MGSNFSEIWINTHWFSSTKMHLKMPSAKLVLGLNILNWEGKQIQYFTQRITQRNNYRLVFYAWNMNTYIIVVIQIITIIIIYVFIIRCLALLDGILLILKNAWLQRFLITTSFWNRNNTRLALGKNSDIFSFVIGSLVRTQTHYNNCMLAFVGTLYAIWG